jgi:hypothetical protein
MGFINSVEVHPQLSRKELPVHGVQMGAGSDVGLLHILCFLSAGDLQIQMFGHACFFALFEARLTVCVR